MRLRITARQSGVVTVVQIDGELFEPGVPELERVCRRIRGPLCLDLANLQSIDAEGVQSIRAFEVQGAALAGASPYVKKLLDRITSERRGTDSPHE
jgi:hypothetical protein